MKASVRSITSPVVRASAMSRVNSYSVRARFSRPEPMEGGLRNVGLIMASLCAFAAASHFVNMTAGIVALVFVSSFAGGHYSTSRNLKISVGLIAVALAFQKLLGLNLPLY